MTERDKADISYSVQASVFSPMAIRFPALRRDEAHLVPSMLVVGGDGEESFVRLSMKTIYDLTYNGYRTRLWTTTDRSEAESKANEYRDRHAERGSDANEYYADVEVLTVPGEQALLTAKQNGFRDNPAGIRNGTSLESSPPSYRF